MRGSREHEKQATLKSITAKLAREEDASSLDQLLPTTNKEEEGMDKSKTETPCEPHREEAQKTAAPQDSDSDSSGDVFLRRIFYNYCRSHCWKR